MQILESVAVRAEFLCDKLRQEHACRAGEQMKTSPEMFISECLSFSFNNEGEVFRSYEIPRSVHAEIIDMQDSLIAVLFRKVHGLQSMELVFNREAMGDIFYYVTDMTLVPGSQSHWS